MGDSNPQPFNDTNNLTGFQTNHRYFSKPQKVSLKCQILFITVQLGYFTIMFEKIKHNLKFKFLSQI